MPSDIGIDGVHNRSYPLTADRYMRLWRASLKADMVPQRSPHTGNLRYTWPGNHWGSAGVHRRFASLPREEVINELRALRQASREGIDPLTIPLSRMKPTAIRRFLDKKGTRLDPRFLIPPAFINRTDLSLP